MSTLNPVSGVANSQLTRAIMHPHSIIVHLGFRRREVKSGWNTWRWAVLKTSLPIRPSANNTRATVWLRLTQLNVCWIQVLLILCNVWAYQQDSSPSWYIASNNNFPAVEMKPSLHVSHCFLPVSFSRFFILQEDLRFVLRRLIPDWYN